MCIQKVTCQKNYFNIYTINLGKKPNIFTLIAIFSNL